MKKGRFRLLAVQDIIESSDGPVSLQQIKDRLKGYGFKKEINDEIIKSDIDALVVMQRCQRCGRGVKADPFMYWIEEDHNEKNA